MNILKKKKLIVKKVILTLVAVLIALLVLISLFAGNYLVNYSIGRSGDGGNRTVALEIPETADDTERTIAEGKIAQQEANEAFPVSYTHLRRGCGKLHYVWCSQFLPFLLLYRSRPLLQCKFLRYL